MGHNDDDVMDTLFRHSQFLSLIWSYTQNLNEKPSSSLTFAHCKFVMFIMFSVHISYVCWRHLFASASPKAGNCCRFSVFFFKYVSYALDYEQSFFYYFFFIVSNYLFICIYWFLFSRSEKIAFSKW